VIRFRRDVLRITIADAKIADVKGIGSRGLQITGKSEGETTVLVYTRPEHPLRLVINVSVATEALRYQMKSIFPGETIIPQAIGKTVVLTGTVSDPVISERAAKLAGSYIKQTSRGGAKVLNFLQIKGKQQVQVRVKIAEVSRTALRELGANMWFRRQRNNATDSSGGLLAPGSPLDPNLAGNIPGTELSGDGTSPGIPLLRGPLAGTFGVHFATQASSVFPVSVALNLLQGKGLAKVLSEPTLVAYSGHKADFLVGGEFPIFIPQGLGQTSIEFKKFGVQLSFTPTVLANESIHLKVSVSVSERDKSGAVSLQGTTVPALATRHSETTVRLRNGQSFAIAGLLHDRISSRSHKVPLLGDIPVLGMLFRQTSFEREERELVILVTTQLVRPLKPGEVPSLPGEDEVADPGAIAFFLLGSIDPEQKVSKRTRPAGPVGYSE
jgi:pilus assembly protein CpaC